MAQVLLERAGNVSKIPNKSFAAGKEPSRKSPRSKGDNKTIRQLQLNKSHPELQRLRERNPHQRKPRRVSSWGKSTRVKRKEHNSKGKTMPSSLNTTIKVLSNESEVTEEDPYPPRGLTQRTPMKKLRRSIMRLESNSLS